ncbi:MAG: hypothetical protein ACLFRX_09455 [Gemmatimonadota bacterium]
MKRITLAAACLAASWGAGCASVPFEPDQRLAERAAVSTSVWEDVARRGAWPRADDMRPDVRLVTPRMWTSGGRKIEIVADSRLGRPDRPPHRDTLTGPAAVSAYLERRRSEDAPALIFELTTVDVLLCDDAVVQLGRYRSPTKRTGGMRVAEQPFTALWRRGDDGRLLLQGLWMAPTSETAGPSSLGKACLFSWAVHRSAQAVGTRWGAVLAGTGVTSAGLPAATPAFSDRDWTLSDGREAAYAATAQLFFRLTPRWQVHGLLEGQLPGSVTYSSHGTRVVLEQWGGLAAALAALEWRSLRLGAGPALAYRQWEWTESFNHSIWEPAAPVSGSLLAPGAILHAAIAQPVMDFLFQASVQHRLFGAVDGPGYLEAELVPASLSATAFSVGVGYTW